MEKNLPSQSIAGWSFTEKEISDALANNRLLMLDFEAASNRCNLGCPYCYTNLAGHRKALDGEMPVAERKSVISQVAEMGAKSIKIIGAGEPFVDKDIWGIIEHIAALGMTPIINSNLYKMGREAAQRLFGLNASIVAKFNSFSSATEDLMADRKGYSAERDKSLGYLLETGFNAVHPTRLGIDTVITRYNAYEVLGIFRFARQNNIWPEIKGFIPTGAACNLIEWKICWEEIEQLAAQAAEIDRVEFGIAGAAGGSLKGAYLGCGPCRQLAYSLHVKITGEATSCVGTERVHGSLKNEPLREIWEKSGRQRKMLHAKNAGHGCFPKFNKYASKTPRMN